jgi:predicted amidophosphoribosyltransferase
MDDLTNVSKKVCTKCFNEYSRSLNGCPICNSPFYLTKWACPDCHNEWYYQEYIQPVCPKCGRIIDVQIGHVPKRNLTQKQDVRSWSSKHKRS